MPKIKVNQATYDRLNERDALRVDTLEEIVDLGLTHLQIKPDTALPSWLPTVKEMQIDPDNLPSMTFTRIIEATVDEQQIEKPSWNRLLTYMLILALQQRTAMDELGELDYIRMIRGRKEDQGYIYLPKVNISVQSQSARIACRAALKIAKKIGSSVNINFIWRAKEGAFYPGQKGQIFLSAASRQGV